MQVPTPVYQMLFDVWHVDKFDARNVSWIFLTIKKNQQDLESPAGFSRAY
jgi:hypothetical protein